MGQNSVSKFSFIIPVYNRPDEIRELLESMVSQTLAVQEVIIVEDGSTVNCETVIEEFKDHLPLFYYQKKNSGPGTSRNYGAERATGDYVIFLDSDCVLPAKYFEVVSHAMTTNYKDAFGGPDAAHDDFTLFQKAINYSMTSFFTTGGIRGGGEKMEKFHPRSFNMGFSREVFDKTKGFSKMRFGEDIDMSIRIFTNGFNTGLIKEAFVFHKRRSSFKQFFKQIYNSGIARINLYKRYPNSLKIVHWAPAVFTIGSLLLLLFSLLLTPLFILPLTFYSLLIFIDATIKNKNILIGLISVLTSYTQLQGYGIGFLLAVWKRLILKKDEFSAFENTFYD